MYIFLVHIVYCSVLSITTYHLLTSSSVLCHFVIRLFISVARVYIFVLLLITCNVQLFTGQINSE